MKKVSLRGAELAEAFHSELALSSHQEAMTQEVTFKFRISTPCCVLDAPELPQNLAFENSK